ncbi:MAG: nitrile hydratase subunit beta [Actinomycetota bacterium]
MDGIHDMGGVEGFGPVPYEPEEPISVGERWESFAGAAFFALERSGRTNIDAHRHRIERLDPTRYLPVSYWGRWLAAVESAMVEQGIASADEVVAAVEATGHDPAATAPPPRLSPTVGFESRENTRGFLRQTDRPARFAVGQRVRTLAHAPSAGHHRLPRYARGRFGVVARTYPSFTLPDAMAHGGPDDPAYVYAIAFDATELWGPGADANQRCHLDVFEPHLEPAEDPGTDPTEREDR